ncbi:MAG: hypothetical protein BWY11_00140 [Firmicutes bacterium ADurb.Bin182]|nr:MAG: hypothetical protein BWY11_00140 [Firmicutes bacterium ADurb.Bin182]
MAIIHGQKGGKAKPKYASGTAELPPGGALFVDGLDFTPTGVVVYGQVDGAMMRISDTQLVRVRESQQSVIADLTSPESYSLEKGAFRFVILPAGNYTWHATGY